MSNTTKKKTTTTSASKSKANTNPPAKASEKTTEPVVAEKTKPVDVEPMVKESEPVVVDNKENEALKQKLADMEKQMSTLMQMMGGNLASPQTANDRDIEVISLITGALILTTTGLDSGQKYEFKNQFDSVLIPESDLRAIVRSMNETARGGYFYIVDNKFVEDARLTSSYRNMMNKTELMEIFDKSCKEFMEVYNRCVEGQKKIIVDMAIGKKLNGEFVDANILIELGKACNRDLMGIETLETLMG